MLGEPTPTRFNVASITVAAAAFIALALGAGALDAGGLAWIRSEWSSSVHHFGRTLYRLLEALAWAGLAVPLAAGMRRWQRLETALTPIMLTLTSVPWVLIAVALNMMIHLRVGPQGAIYLAALGCGAWLLGALAPRQQTSIARHQSIRRALRVALVMLVAAELLTLSDGVGSQVRFYVLYWSPPLLFLYGGMSLAVIAATLAVGRLLGHFLTRLTATLAEPRG